MLDVKWNGPNNSVGKGQVGHYLFLSNNSAKEVCTAKLGVGACCLPVEAAATSHVSCLRCGL